MKPAGSARKSHYIYFLLAAFDILTVCVGMYFNHSMTSIYVESVTANQTWAERVAQFSRFGQLAAAANAPGNDVFGSGDVRGELARMNSATGAFQRQFWKVRKELQVDLPPHEAGPLLAKLDAVAHAMEDMTGEARLIFVHFRADQPMIAGARMATMDRKYAQVHRAIDELRASVTVSQRQRFDRQMAAAATQEKYQYLIGALVLLMVGAATLYGHRMAKQAQCDAAERERQSAQLEASNRRLLGETAQTQIALRALQETNGRLQSLFKRTLETEERQRQHIARELHEEVSQMLASLKMRLGALDKKKLVPLLKGAGSLADSALHRLQDLVHDLTPHGMDLVGLAAVLPVHLREWTRHSGLKVHFTERLRARAPFRIESAAYRVAQEAVSNAIRHARARNLRVDLRSTDHELQLRVSDDGAGFDAQSARRHSSLGLALMEQRTTALGGRLEIRSTPARGTTVLAAFPLQQQIDWVGGDAPISSLR